VQPTAHVVLECWHPKTAQKARPVSTYSSTPSKLGISCAIVLVAAFASSANAEEYAKTYTISGRADVHVRADNGGVRILSSDGSKVEFDVKYEKSDWGSESNAGPHIESQQNGNRVELTALVGEHGSLGWWGWSNNRRLSIEVHMPKNADLQLDTSNGAVDVSSLNGTVSIHTSNGGIKAEDLSGTIDIGSTNGGIILDGLKGTIKVGTTNGGVKATRLDGKCELSTTNGGVHVAGRFEALDISSGNGTVVAEAESGSRVSSAWNIRTTNAGIDLALPPDLKANVDASTTNGSVTVDLPSGVQGIHSGTEVRGAMNGGGPEMTLRTTNGGIHVRGI
jgi:DUF4097 and DUF4098 domain-containing protein YvlB